jgi:hypothetical protein
MVLFALLFRNEAITYEGRRPSGHAPTPPDG